MISFRSIHLFLLLLAAAVFFNPCENKPNDPEDLSSSSSEENSSSSSLINRLDANYFDTLETNKTANFYFEDDSNSKVAETLAKATGAKLLVINTVEGLSDQQKKDGANYISLMQENLKSMEKTIK